MNDKTMLVDPSGEKTPVPAPNTSPEYRLIAQAIEKGESLGDAAAAIQSLVTLHNTQQDREADREMVRALQRFQGACPPIKKTATAKIATRSGGGLTYRYAPLDEIMVTITPALEECGLSVAWDNLVVGDTVYKQCKLSHIAGATRQAVFPVIEDSRENRAISGGQKHAQAATFARRYALIDVLGIVTADEDNDNALPPEAEVHSAPISDETVGVIERLLEQTGDPDRHRARACAFAKVATIELIPAPAAQRIIDGLTKIVEQTVKAFHEEADNE